MSLQVQLEENFGNIKAGSVTADILSGATTAVGAGEVGATELADDAVTANKAYFVSATSPVVGGYNVQAGTGTLADGSVWVAFSKPFIAAPVVVTQIDDQALNYDVKFRVCPGSVDTGSFLAVGSDATTTFNWIAIGSGTF